MTIKAVKVSLTKSEISFVELCLDVFDTYRLDGLIYLASHTPCVNQRPEVFFAIAQSVKTDLDDEQRGGRSLFPQLETFADLLTRLFESRMCYVDNIDPSDWWSDREIESSNQAWYVLRLFAARSSRLGGKAEGEMLFELIDKFRGRGLMVESTM